MGKTKQSKSLNLAVIFSVVLALLILISIILKIINVFQKSTFDGNNHYIVSVIGKTNSVSLISFSPRSNAIYLLNVKEGKNKNLGKTLQVPIDGEIYADVKISDKNVKTSLFKFLIPFSIDKTNLTLVDLFRLWFYANSVPINSIYQQEISANDNLTELKISGVYSYFVDQKIAEEKTPIEIVNGTEVFGLGNKLASFLSNIGANVVMVSTSKDPIEKSSIDYVKDENYTLDRVSRLLDILVNKTDRKSFGDITIIIGKDYLEKINF